MGGVGSPRGPVWYMSRTVVASKGTTVALGYEYLIGCGQPEEVTGREVGGGGDQSGFSNYHCLGNLG
jgi:hypothetical protein